jgi:outer membrane protein assembly factor BamB
MQRKLTIQASVKKPIKGISIVAAAAAALLTSAAPAMASEWSSSRGNAGNTGSQGETLELPLTERWHSSAPRVEENGAVVSGGVVYMSSTDGFVYAFNVKSGEGVAGFPVTTTGNFGTPAVDATNKKVYALAGSTLYAFEFNGTSAWTKEAGATGTNYNVGPVIDEGFVYVKAGSTLKKYDSTGALQWSSESSGDNTQPAVLGSFVYVNSEAGSIRKYDKATGKEVTTGGFPITTSSSSSSAGLAAVNGKIFVKADKLFAYNASNGETLWSAEDGGENSGTYNDSPAVSGGFVYTFGWGDGKAYAFNETTGAPATGFPSVELNAPASRNWSSPTVAGDKVYIGAGTSQKLKVLGAAGTANAGVVLAEYPTFSADPQGFDLPSPVVAEGFVFAMLDGGGLYAFSPGKAAPGKIKINGGAECTTSRNVTLEIEFGTNTEMRISEDPLFKTASFEPVAATKSFELSEGFGEKTVYIQFKDKEGNLSNVFNAKINFAATCNKAKPTTTTTALSGEGKTGESITVKEGSPVTDQATIAGENAATATGMVTYKVYSDKECTKEVASAGELTVSAGKAPASEAKTLAPGTYYWQASYGGDANNNASKNECGTEVETVTEPERPISATGMTLGGTEAAKVSGTVASFTDPETKATASEYSATIEWGDGTSSSGTVSGGGGNFAVSGEHTYADEGSYTVKVVITDVDNESNGATTESTAKIADAALSASGVSATSPMAFSGTVAKFTDANSSTSSASDFTATIEWGDGAKSAGKVSGSGGSFSVKGSHTYASTGSFKVVVKIVDDGGSTAEARSKILILAPAEGGSCDTNNNNGNNVGNGAGSENNNGNNNFNCNKNSFNKSGNEGNESNNVINGSTVTAGAAPGTDSGVQGSTSTGSKTGMRHIRIHIHVGAKAKLKKVTVKVDGKTVAVLKGKKASANVNLVNLPCSGNGATTIVVIAVTDNGRTIRESHQYRLCQV